MTRTLCYYLPSFQLVNMRKLGRNNKGRITAAVSKQGISAINSMTACQIGYILREPKEN